MTATPVLSLDDLAIDAEAEADRICEVLVDHLAASMRRGAVVALSGGLDSSVTAALCVRALGQERVFGLHLPERESSPDFLRCSRLVSGWLGIDSEVEDVTGALEAVGCYRRRDEAIRTLCPPYDVGWRAKLVLPSVLDSDHLRLHVVVVQAPDGTQTRHRLTPEAHLAIVAATGFKQRIRAVMAHHHADRRNYLTVGATNRVEHDQGLYVRLGDGSEDVTPLAHLYKTQVHALAAFLDVPEAVRQRTPTTDTWPLPVSQEEYYFSLPWELMDLCLLAHNRRVPASAAALATGLTEEQVERVFRDIDQKRRATRNLHLAPRMVEPVAEVDPVR